MASLNGVHLLSTVEPTIKVNIRRHDHEMEMEWDGLGCESLTADQGKWSRLRLGGLVPTQSPCKFLSKLLSDWSFGIIP
ncbi:MAG: hypothetical protein EA367_07300 [Leptolyngbya sp. DLM2.Bin15]|nr:MAG: hypothetical protein EA367_07300 [Leptolyngbya sp. DLM2.Bin15]